MIDEKIVASIKGVSKKIGRKTIIDHISFDIYAGEVFGFIGPNGAGKTTTIRMMVGLMSISEGDIIIHGQSIQKNFEAAIGHVGAIVENPEMYKYLTGYQNLLHYAKMMSGISRDRIDEVTHLVGLEKRIHEKVKGYSLGMRQRLGLAQALLHSPSFLILDEPTNGLDPAGIRELRSYLRRIASEDNIAILVSSHLLSEMEQMCDRIGIIDQGKMIGVYSIQEFIQSKEETIQCKVDSIQIAAELIRKKYSEGKVAITDDCLQINLEKDSIPELIEYLVQHQIRIFEVRNVSKSLEEKFLEVVGGIGVA